MQTLNFPLSPASGAEPTWGEHVKPAVAGSQCLQSRSSSCPTLALGGEFVT